MKKKQLPKEKMQKRVTLSGASSAADLQKRAMARAEFAARPTVPPIGIVFVQPDGSEIAGARIECDSQRAIVTVGMTGERKVYERGTGESLEEFKARVAESQPRDGKMRSIFFEPVIVGNYKPPVIECNPFPGQEVPPGATRVDGAGNPIL